jgi:hypothetical protein
MPESISVPLVPGIAFVDQPAIRALQQVYNMSMERAYQLMEKELKQKENDTNTNPGQ